MWQAVLIIATLGQNTVESMWVVLYIGVPFKMIAHNQNYDTFIKKDRKTDPNSEN